MKKILGAMAALAVAGALLWWFKHSAQDASAPGKGATVAPLAPSQGAQAKPNQVALATYPPAPVVADWPNVPLHRGIPFALNPDPKATADPRAELKSAIDDMVRRLETGDDIGFIQLDEAPGMIASWERDITQADIDSSPNIKAYYQQKLAYLRLFQRAWPARTGTTPEGEVVEFEIPVAISTETSPDGIVIDVAVPRSGDNGAGAKEGAFADGWFIKINGLWYDDD